jgi:hypothetical protein
MDKRKNKKKENIENRKEYIMNMLNGMFFFILLLTSGIISGFLNCDIQKLLENNIFITHIIIFSTIYFFRYSSFVNTGTLQFEKKHPIYHFLNSIIIYLFFILLMRMNFYSAIIAFIIFFLTHLIYEYNDYYKNKNNNIIFNKKNINIIYSTLLIILIINIIIGVVLNYLEYKNNYNNFLYFIFNVTKCNNINEPLNL